MRNVPINNHPLVGSEPRVFGAHLPAYDPDKDREGGILIVGPGMTVGIKAVFQNWNDVPGLDMLYVYCFATGMHTHVTPFDLGLNPLDPDTAETESYTTLVVERHDGWYYVGPLDPAKRILLEEYGDFITETEPNKYGVSHVYEWRSNGTDPGVERANQWGSGHTSDEAWRYLIGADFGPVDEEYDDLRLRDLIQKHTS